jgi:hypothetical protein
MDIGTSFSASAPTTMASVADQAAMYALKKSLDASKAQSAALAQLIEQVPAPEGTGHQIDFYA